ncbi:MAG: hypothetical protein KDD53_01515 [Bdellovibrionales bacterium]|nr:hypothetical protein [Bdellovibrionales bacterium]
MKQNAPITLREFGFSLIEMVAILAIFGVLCLTSTISLGKADKSTKLQIFAENLRFQLDRIAINSKVQGYQYQIQFNPTAYRVVVIRQLSVDAVESISIPNSLSLSWSSGDELGVKCFPSGACSPANISIESKYAKCVLRLSLRGRTSMKCN